MTAPSLTYTLTNGTSADAAQVQQNFTDLLLGYTDASKDLSINKLTTASTINKVTITAPATSATLTIADGKALVISNSLTFTGSDSTSFAFPSASSTVMTLASADTITGVKSFNSGKLALNGSSSGSGSLLPPAAASTYTWTLPAATGTLMDLALAQTATSKTFTTPTLTLPVIGDTTDSTKAIAFTLSGATTAKTLTLISAHTNNRSITFPDATDTLMGKATTDVMTNKTVSGGTISGTVTMSSTPVFSGAVSLDGAVTINDTGAAVVFRVEGDTETNLICTDGTNNRVGFGTAAPSVRIQSTISGDQAARFDRTSSDGEIVGFLRDGAQQGAITCTAGVVTLTAFLGSHPSQFKEPEYNVPRDLWFIKKGDGPTPFRKSGKEIPKGTVVCSVDELVDEEIHPSIERHPKCRISDKAFDPSVYGIYLGEKTHDESWGHIIGAVGAGFVRATAENGPIAVGDLLCSSSRPGLAMRQGDDIIRACTLGKARQSHAAFEEALIACTIIAG